MNPVSGLIHRFGVHAVTGLQVLALLPPTVLTIAERGFHMFQVLMAAAIAALVWEAVFALVRKQPLSAHGVTTAMIVTVLAPSDLLLWQLAVAVSLGVVIGELIFGGRGFGFLNAAAVSLALLGISFPGLQLAAPTLLIALASLPGAVLLVLAGLLSWRVLVATVIGFAVAGLLAFDSFNAIAVFAGLTFGLVFLIGDPTGSATTGPGRWAYGLLAGALIVLFSGGTMAVTPQAMVSSAVLVGVFAPLIDHLAVLANAHLRGRRHV